MKTSPRLCLISAVLALTTILSGCVAIVAGAAGAGTVAWVRGELQATLDSNYESTVRAANRAIEQLQFAKVNDKTDALTATITARTADDKKIQVKVTKVSDQATKVAIRVGTFGDQSVSQAILDKIKAAL